MATKPWDSRLARLLVLPLRGTRVHPNHVTTVGLATGLAAAALYAAGTPRAANWGALVFLVAAILDHADGELARLTGKTSDFGRAYDRFSDLLVKLTLFVGMGLGLRAGRLGRLGVICGLAAGVAFVTIFLLRGAIARMRGWEALTQPAAGGFEIEDILYIIAPITWLGLLAPFVVAAGVGAPLFSLWIAWEYRGARAATSAGHPGVLPDAHP